MAEATPAQIANLEKARLERNKHQALLSQITILEDRVEALGKPGVIFHDGSFSYTQHASRLRALRNSWPELFDEMESLFGTAAY